MNLAASLGRSIGDAVLRTAIRATDPALRRYARPCLMDLHPRSLGTYLDARDLLRDPELALWPGAPDALDAAAGEHAELAAELRERYPRARLTFPVDYAVADGASLVLYALVRALRPRVVVETGVANGHSTFFLLHALRRNGAGTLTSIDVSPSVGPLLTADERGACNLVLLRRGRERADFRAAVAALPAVDLFHHDSLHRYAWQTLEYETVEQCAPQALITSDDADGSYAFVDYCERRGRGALFLVEPRKVFGIVVR